MLSRECLHDQLPIVLGIESLSSSPVDNTLHVLSHLIAGGIKCTLNDSPGTGFLEAVFRFLTNFAYTFCPFTDIALYILL